MLTRNVPVIDPFGVCCDPSLPGIQLALDPAEAEVHIGALLESESAPAPVLRNIRVTRYKPGRRCMVEYEFQSGMNRVTVLGKVRSRGLDRRTYCVQQSLFHSGVAVPAPVGMVDGFDMWVQQRVPGTDLMSQLMTGEPVPSRIFGHVAGLIHSLHCAGVPSAKMHGIGDELAILHKRLGSLAHERPSWSGRIDRVLLGAERIGRRLQSGSVTGIHRDFYPDQVIVDGDRLWLVDLDLYSMGDAGLDIGNFTAHLIELGLRQFDDPWHFRAHQREFEESYLTLAGEQVRDAIDVYTTLSLARHIQLSTLFPERRHLTGHLLDLTEERLRDVS